MLLHVFSCSIPEYSIFCQVTFALKADVMHTQGYLLTSVFSVDFKTKTLSEVFQNCTMNWLKKAE